MKNADFISQTYKETLGKLKEGSRPLLQLNSEEILLCLHHWRDLLKNEAKTEEFLPLLCILDHAKFGSLEFKEVVKETIQRRDEPALLVHTLSASHKVIIEECQRQGERIPGDFILALVKPLDHSDPEVVEWTLRTIEALGHQSILVKDEVLKRRPGFSALFNKHRRASQQLVDYLVKRWEGKTI